MNSKKEIQALLDFDAKRFTIRKQQHKMLKSQSPTAAEMYARSSGIDKSLQGRNQYPEEGFHSAMIERIDQKRDRTEVQRLHHKVKYAEN